MHKAILLPVFLALAGCAVSTPALRTAIPPDPQSQMPALENRIEALVEARRLAIDPKAKPLARDPELVRVARERAADMAAKNYLAHVAPNGDTSATLLMAEDASFQGLLGENLAAWHYTRQSGIDVNTLARHFLDTWANSAPHRENLAYPDYDRTGVGAAANGDTVYVTQLFATEPGPKRAPGQVRKTAAFVTPAAARKAAEKPPARLRGAEGMALPSP